MAGSTVLPELLVVRFRGRFGSALAGACDPVSRVLDIPETLRWTAQPDIGGIKIDALFLSYRIVDLLPVLSTIADKSTAKPA
jgi:hypothetical protein